MLFRIVRINGDGTIRIIANGSVGKSSFTYDNALEKLVGYTYDNSKPNVQDGNDSIIKKYVDDWYQNNIKEKYDSLFATSRYCNDTSVANETENHINYGTTKRYITPSFICPNTDKLYGGEYNLKVGLITADEFIYAGNLYQRANTDYYLYNSNYTYYTMSPLEYSRISHYTDIFIQYNDGTFTHGNVKNAYDIFPVLNLRSDTMFASGTGTKDDPYILK